MAAPMPVHIAISADIDQHVETILPPRNPRSKSSRLPRDLQRHIEHFRRAARRSIRAASHRARGTDNRMTG